MDDRPGPCIACGSDAPAALAYVKWRHPIFRCRACGLGWTPGGPGFDPASYYDEGYFRGARRDGYLDYPASEPVLRGEFRRTVAALRRHAPARGRLLEVGCAYGFFLLEAAPHFVPTGVEVAEAAVAACRARGLAVHHTVAEAVAAGRGPFDVAVLLDCIEHLADPAATLTAVRAALTPGGVVLVTTGDWRSLLARAMGPRWRLMTPPQHLFYFSRATLTALLERLGFAVVRCDRPWKVVPLGLAAYQVGSRLGVRLGPLEGVRLGLPVNLFDTIRVVARRV